MSNKEEIIEIIEEIIKQYPNNSLDLTTDSKTVSIVTKQILKELDRVTENEN